MKYRFLKEILTDDTEIDDDIFLNEENIPLWRQRMSSPDYYIRKQKEYSLFDYILTSESNLPVDLMVDLHGISEFNKHPLWLYFSNGYSDKAKFVPILIDRHPEMPYPVKLKISQKDYNKIIDFIKVCYKELIEVSEEKFDIYELLDLYNEYKNFSDSINEGMIYFGNQIMLLNEMPIFEPDITGLPVKIWIDPGSYNNSHHSKSYRLKFENPIGNKDFNTWATMTIPSKEVLNDEPKASSTVVKWLSYFIDNNLDLLNKFAVGDKNANRKLFTDNVIKVDKDGTILGTKYYEYTQVEGFDNIEIVKDNLTGLYNIKDKRTGEYISMFWCKMISTIKKYKNSWRVYVVKSTGETGFLYSSGLFEKTDY